MSSQYQNKKASNAKKKRVSIGTVKHIASRRPVHRTWLRRTCISSGRHSKDTKDLEETKRFLESLGLEKTDKPQGSYSVFF